MKRLLGATVAATVVTVAACAPPPTPEPPYCPSCTYDGQPGATNPPPTPTPPPNVTASVADLTSFCWREEQQPDHVGDVWQVQVHMANDRSVEDFNHVNRFAVRWQWHIGGDVTGSGLGWSEWLETPVSLDADNDLFLQAQVGNQTETTPKGKSVVFSDPTWTDDMTGMPVAFSPTGEPWSGWDETYLQVEYKFGRVGVQNPDTTFKRLYGRGADANPLTSPVGGGPTPICIARGGA